MILCFRPVKEYGCVLNKERTEQGMYLPWGRPVVNGYIVIDMNQLCEQVGKRYGTNRNQGMNGKTVRPYYPAHRYLPLGWKFPSGLLYVYHNWAQRIRIHRVTPGIT